MQELSSHVAKAINTAISSSWAVFVAATVALFLFFYGASIGLDRQRVDLHFLVDAATFLMVFVIEHTQSREMAALHTKLDASIRALDADTSLVGIEELSQKEIQDIRDRRRARTPGARVRSSATLVPRASRSSTRRTSASASNGFAITSLTPKRAKACSARSGRAVRNRTGTSTNDALPRSRSKTSIPLRPGIETSRITRSGCVAEI